MPPQAKSGVGEFGAAFAAAGLQHLAATTGTHAADKAMLAVALALFGLECSFHDAVLPIKTHDLGYHAIALPHLQRIKSGNPLLRPSFQARVLVYRKVLFLVKIFCISFGLGLLFSGV